MFKLSYNLVGIMVFILTDIILSQQIPDGEYLGQEPPGLAAEVFAPGIISLEDRRETKVVFSPDGQEAFIGTTSEGKFKIFYTKQENSHWQEPRLADFIINQDSREPFVAPNGEKFFCVL